MCVLNLEKRQRVTLIGMPTAGKTKIGKLLAELLGWNFIDIDDCIVIKRGANSLKEVVDELGSEFTQLEGLVAIETVKNISMPTIIATGGSVIYSEEAMEYLYHNTHIIHLLASLMTIERRVAKNPDRGIVYKPGQTLTSLYFERMPLYHKWAHETVGTNHHRRSVARQLAHQLMSEVPV